MKKISKITLLSLAISGLITVHSAFAEPANTLGLNKGEPAHEEPKKCDLEVVKAKRLETLKSELKLNVNQEAAWTEWVGQIMDDPKNWQEKREDFKSLAILPAPERMEKMLAFSKEHIAKQEAHLAATKTFYATLTPGQRKAFDKGFNFEHHGHFRKNWKK